MMPSSNATNLILLDTDVASFFLKAHPFARDYFPLVEGKIAALSFMTVAELYQWAEIRLWGPVRRAALEQHLKQRYLKLESRDELSKEWARVRAEGKAAGQPIAVQDAWIAATARYYAVPLVTHNQKHFENVEGLELKRP